MADSGDCGSTQPAQKSGVFNRISLRAILIVCTIPMYWCLGDVDSSQEPAEQFWLVEECTRIPQHLGELKRRWLRVYYRRTIEVKQMFWPLVLMETKWPYLPGHNRSNKDSSAWNNQILTLCLWIMNVYLVEFRSSISVYNESNHLHK